MYALGSDARNVYMVQLSSQVMYLSRVKGNEIRMDMLAALNLGWIVLMHGLIVKLYRPLIEHNEKCVSCD